MVTRSILIPTMHFELHEFNEFQGKPHRWFTLSHPILGDDKEQAKQDGINSLISECFRAGVNVFTAEFTIAIENAYKGVKRNDSRR